MNVPAETIGTVLASSLAAITGAFKAFQFVQEGERGIKLTFGKAVRDEKGVPKVIDPGFIVLIPFVQRLAKHHVRQQSYRFPEQHVTLKDGLIYRVGGMVIYKVNDVYKALFEIDSIDNSIDDLCMATIRDELQTLNHEDLQSLDEVSKKLLARVKSRAGEWGIELLDFRLPECAPTPETANLINASIGVRMRLAALDEELRKYQMTLQTVPPNLAAVLVGIPVATTINSDRGSGATSDLNLKSHEVEAPAQSGVSITV